MLLVVTRPSLFRKPSDHLTFVRYQLITEHLESMLTLKHTHTHPHTQTVTKTNNKPAGSRFFPSCLLSVYTTNLQVLFKLSLFYSALAGYTNTHLLETVEKPLLQHINMHTHTHCVFPVARCHQASQSAARCDIITLRHSVLQNPPTPMLPHPPGAACQSVSVISDSMLD